MDVCAALGQLHGAARQAELLRHGVSRRALSSAVRSGSVVRLETGLYCLPGSQSSDVTAAVRLNGVLSCGSAALHHGLEAFGRVSLHVTTTSTPNRPGRGVSLHRRRVECDARVTTLRQTLLDCCRCLPRAQAVSVLDSAVRQGRVDLEELTSLAPRRGRSAKVVRETVRLVDPKAQSVLESAARVLLVGAAVGVVESQVEVPRVGWVDVVVDGWLVVEVDGYAVHRDRFREDRRRDAELVRQGFVVLRFTYEDLERRPEWVLRVVRETLAHGGPAHRRARER